MKIDVSRSTARMLMRAMKKGFNGLDGETPEDYNQAIRVLFRLAYYNDNVFLTTSEVEKQSLSWSLYDDSIFTGQKGNNFKESLEQYKIVDFTTHRHDKKLDLIQFVFKKAEELYSNNKTDLGLIFDIILKYYEQYFQKSNEGPFNMLDKGFSFLKGINITKLFEKKNDGFYVNFKNGKAIAPKDEPFQINELISVFVITYLLLNIILNYLDGFDLTSPKTDLKKLLGKIYDMLPDYVKKSLSDIDE